MQEKRGQKIEKVIMNFPVAFWMIFFIAIPMLYIFVMSFLRQGETKGVVLEPTITNYINAFTPLNLSIIGESIWISLVVTVICLLIAYPFAYFVSRKSAAVRTVCMAMIMIPFMVSSLIRLFSWITILRKEGLINSFLLKTGIIHRALELCYNTNGVIVGLVYTLLPFMILPLYSSIEKLDRSLLEAAGDLGAKPLQRFIRIILPLTFPGILAGIIMVFIPTLGLFYVTDVMGGNKVQVIGNLIHNQFITARNWPEGAALSILLILITFLFLALYRKFGGDMEKLGGA